MRMRIKFITSEEFKKITLKGFRPLILIRHSFSKLILFLCFSRIRTEKSAFFSFLLLSIFNLSFLALIFFALTCIYTQYFSRISRFVSF